MTGRVILVGGGPGADDLITVRGLDRLLAADVVISDRLAPTGLLSRLRPGVELIDASRTPDHRTLTYDEIVELMISRARAGQTVVRLKGGDPFVLAHGPQEVQSCTAAGIAVEVVPGLTSAIAAPVLAGVPLTATDGAAGFTVVSGHLAPDDLQNPLDWTAISRSGSTIVVLMGMRHLAAITTRLLAEGLDPSTPASCVANASRPSERAVHSPLSELAERVTAAELSNPAVVIIAGRPVTPAQRTLVLGGSRSGKSRFAEQRLAGASAVDYLATATGGDDQEWRERIRAHQERRPATWTTIETADVAAHLSIAGAPTLLDSVTTWLARAMDECGFWAGGAQADAALAERVDRFCAAWADTSRRVVAVSDEVGSGIVPDTASGRRIPRCAGTAQPAPGRDGRRGLSGHRRHRAPAGMNVRGLRNALSMFTITPVRWTGELDPDEARATIDWLPLLGVLIGAVAGLPVALIRAQAPQAGWIGAVIGIGALAVITRGLHLDGLADTADGLASREPAAQALDIMRRSDIGPFGVLTLIFVLGLDISSLAIVGGGDWRPVAALAVAAATGRVAVLQAAHHAVPSARPTGFGALVAGSVSTGMVLAQTAGVLVLGAAVAYWSGASPWQWVVIQGLALLVTGGVRTHVVHRLGGVTGDVFGALLETGVVLTLVGIALVN